MILIRCPECRQKYSVKDSAVGKYITCAKCDYKFKVATVDSSDDRRNNPDFFPVVEEFNPNNTEGEFSESEIATADQKMAEERVEEIRQVPVTKGPPEIPGEKKRYYFHNSDNETTIGPLTQTQCFEQIDAYELVSTYQVNSDGKNWRLAADVWPEKFAESYKADKKLMMRVAVACFVSLLFAGAAYYLFMYLVEPSKLFPPYVAGFIITFGKTFMFGGPVWASWGYCSLERPTCKGQIGFALLLGVGIVIGWAITVTLFFSTGWFPAVDGVEFGGITKF